MFGAVGAAIESMGDATAWISASSMTETRNAAIDRRRDLCRRLGERLSTRVVRTSFMSSPEAIPLPLVRRCAVRQRDPTPPLGERKLVHGRRRAFGEGRA